MISAIVNTILKKMTSFSDTNENDRLKCISSDDIPPEIRVRADDIPPEIRVRASDYDIDTEIPDDLILKLSPDHDETEITDDPKWKFSH